MYLSDCDESNVSIMKLSDLEPTKEVIRVAGSKPNYLMSTQ